MSASQTSNLSPPAFFPPVRMICSGAMLLALAGLGGCGTYQDDIEFSAIVARYDARCAAPPGAPLTEVAPGDAPGRRSVAFVLAEADRGAQVDVDPADLPWRQRRGQAYPGRFWPSLGHDVLEWPETLVDDVKATATSNVSLALFAAAGVSGAALANSDADDKVNDHYEKHGAQLGSFADDVGDVSGSAALHFGIAGSAYVAGMALDDDKTARSAKAMVNALALTGVTTLALKSAVDTDRPNGTGGGWPSGHASGSFCFATVVYHEYGFWPGAGAYAAATFSAYQRIDSQYHYLSDVVSGALIGVAFGHAVAGNHKPEILGMDVVPYVGPETGAVGLALTKQW